MSQEIRERLGALQQALDGLRSGALSPHAFASAARGESALLGALPPRYGEVLNGLLDRLESSALFAEESCSFSQGDLADSVQLWIDKAGATLTGR